MDVATVKGVVDRLRDKGLIGSRPDPGDGRRSLISLTEAGELVIAELKAAGSRITTETLAPLEVAEREVFVGLLRKLT